MVYSIKLKKEELEIQVSGEDKEFVKTLFEDAFDKLSNLPNVQKRLPNYSNPEISSITNDSIQSSHVNNSNSELIGDCPDKLKKICLDVEIGSGELESLFLFDESYDSFKLIRHTFSSIKTGAEKQRIAVKLILLLNFYLSGLKTMSSKSIIGYFDDANIPKGDLGKNCKSDRDLVINGKSYVLTPTGRENTIKLLRSISENA